MPWLAFIWLDEVGSERQASQIILNLAPLWTLWLALWVCLRRPLAVAVWTAFACALFLLANAEKLRHLRLPLMPGDLQVAHQLVSAPELFLRYAGNAWPLLLLVAVGVLASVFEPRRRVGPWPLRLALLIVAGSQLALLPAGRGVLAQPYRSLDAAVWTPAAAARDVGPLAFFVHLWPSSRVLPPRPDDGHLTAGRQRFPARPAALVDSAEQPDLIVLQSESFFDPRRLVGMQHTQHTPQLDALRGQHAHGDLWVPTFGGLTTRTEFEVLTGFPLAALDNPQYPYQGLVHEPLPSLAWSLRALGYRTHAIHPYHRRFYRRDVVYPLLGFEAFHAVEEFAGQERRGLYVSDHALGQRLMDLVDGSDAPMFVFAVSMENHGPWGDVRPLPPEAIEALAVPPELDAETADSLRRYLYHVQQTDAAFGELVDWAATRSRRTLILFFGDHLPGLVDVYAKLPFVDGAAPEVQPLPWLLYDNRESAGGAPQNLAAHQLAALLLDHGRLNEDPYFLDHSQLRQPLAMADPLASEYLVALARQRFAATPPAPKFVDRPLPRQAEPQVQGWRPNAVEMVDLADENFPVLQLRGATALPRTVHVELDGEPMRSVRISDRLLHVHFTSHGARQLLTRPAQRPLRLHYGANQMLDLGALTIRPRSPRAQLGDGRVAHDLCEITRWGPQETPRQQPANRQPDGRMGVWMAAPCFPSRVVVEIDGDAHPATRDGDLVTLAIAPERLLGDDQLELVLLDAAREERLPVGTLRIIP